MEFRLLYEGPLQAASSGNKRASEKQALRRHFHKQLRRLWFTNSNLVSITQRIGMAAESQSRAVSHNEETMETCLASGWKDLGARNEQFGFSFIPLVKEEFRLKCNIDILFLRPSGSAALIHGGDLDNRLKTLFDGLRMPHSKEELAGTEPTEDEQPFFCLLEDDRLISEIKVTSDNLLLLPKEKELRPHDVFLAITVNLSPTVPHNWAWVF